MDLNFIIDKVIKELWISDIAADYEAHRLLKEDCLKNCFYYHLRRRLGDDFLEANNLQIFTEFNDGPLHSTGKRADITELIASYNEDHEIEFDVVSYNDLNQVA